MTKKILSVFLAVLLAVSCVAFTVSAEEIVYFVEEGANGNGSEITPFSTINEAIDALKGKDGTIMIYGTYNINNEQNFNDVAWDGMITFKGVDKDAVIAVADGATVRLRGDVTFKDIKFTAGQYSHLNPYGKLIMDAGNNSEFSQMFHLTTLENENVSEAYASFLSGSIGKLYAAGAYCDLNTSGCEGDSTIIVDGATVQEIVLAADHYMDTQVGISIGGNLNVIVNSGSVNKITYDEQTIPYIIGALNLVFNNGTAPEEVSYPDVAFEGSYVIRAGQGGVITPTSVPGVFEVKADEGKVAKIDGEVVNNGNVTLTAGKHEVEWFGGEQGTVASTEIKLVIGKAEIVTNGVAKTLDVPAQIINERTYVPVRVIFEALGATVEWDDTTKTVLSSKDGKTVNLPVGKAVVVVDGVEQAAVAEALIVNSRTLVPARAVAEAYCCAVAWDDATKTVTITK